MNLPDIILLIINIILFLIFAVIIWIIPGSYVLSKKDKLPRLDKLLLSTTFGFALYALALFIIRLLNLPFWLCLIPFLSFSVLKIKNIKILKLRKSLAFNFTNSYKTLLILLVIGAMIQGLSLTRSAIRVDEGIKFLEISAHDSFQHIYLINELKEYFPPRHPSFSPVLVTNYHFLLDLILASILKYLPLSIYDLYYRIFPVFTSTLLSLSVFVFTRKIISSALLANIAVAITMFSGNAAWFVKLFRQSDFTVSANTFMLDPVIDLMQNPIAVIVFPLMLAGTYGLLLFEKKANWRLILLSSVTFGVMVGFKAWGGTLAIISLGTYALALQVLKKRLNGWIILALATLITVSLFLPVYNPQTASNPVFAPGWLLKRMVEDPDRFNMQKYYFLEEHYKSTNNIFRLIQLNVLEIAIYILGNYWVRVIGLFYILFSLKRISASKVFMVTLVILSLSFPLLFNQGRMSYDIVQFGPYSQVFLSIFTALAFSFLLKRLPGYMIISLAILLITFSFPSNFKSIRDRYSGDSFVVTNEALKAYQVIKEDTAPESNIMVYPSVRNDAILLVPAFTQRPTYFSGKSFARLTGEDYETRMEKWRNFFNNIDPGKRNKEIREGNINYILLTQEENSKFNPSGVNIDEFYQNNKYIIYQIQ